MSSTFGHVFRIHTFGESHGGGVGVVIDGCPPRIPVSVEQIQHELDRRRPGQSEIVTPRKEADTAEILSGLQDGVTLGCPIAILVRNTDQRPGAYDEMAQKYRPSHADFTYDAKYGIRSGSGGGRASARETIGRVAAAAVARQVLDTLPPGIEILVPLMLTAVAYGRITLERLVALLITNSAEIFGMAGRKGVIAVGADADLMLVDLAAEGRIDTNTWESKSRVTARLWHGRQTRGAVVSTFVRGQQVSHNGQVIGQPGWGRFVAPTPLNQERPFL